MRRTEPRSTTSTRDVLVEAKCDLCGRNTRKYLDSADENDYGTDRYHSDRITIEREHGDSYPEGSFLTRERVDMCPTCWTAKLVPWLKSLGVTTTTTEVD